MEFRPRDYRTEEEAYSLPRVRVHSHPLSALPSNSRVEVMDNDQNFSDPLRGFDANTAMSIGDLREEDNTSVLRLSFDVDSQLSIKEWTSFKKFLMQRFTVSKTIPISSASVVIIKSVKVNEKSSANVHLDELEDPQRFAEEDAKFISQKEYISRLCELKDEITHAWHNEDRVTALKLSIKVTRLLMDTSVAQFYPTLFVLATDVMDMLGDMVWERIKQKAEFAEDGIMICSLSENFEASDICMDAKETCNNWFCKVGSIRELLPRIYLELAILRCWRFLVNQPASNLQRLVMMIRGIGDPLASAYCCLYMVHCAQKIPQCDKGYLITCINDLKVLLMRIISAKENTDAYFAKNRSLLVSLMEPTIEYIVKSLLKDSYQAQAGDILVGLGLARNQLELCEEFSCISIILHHLLRELPIEVVTCNAVEILHLIESNNDSSFDQCLNYRLLGFRLSERVTSVDVTKVIDKVIQVVSQYNGLEEYLKVVEAYVDIVLQNDMDSYLNVVLDGIFEHACKEKMIENELTSLQSIFVKLLTHFNNIENIFALKHFIDILDVMHGSSRTSVDMHILNMATRNSRIRDPTTIQLLLEVSQSLHDAIDFSNIKKDDIQQPARLISRFVGAVDYGAEVERHLTFLIECRAAFGSLDELKETIIHVSNSLIVKVMKDGKNHQNIIKSCLAFSEVTIPSIPAQSRQLNLYLETAEVALLGGFISHSDGLLDSAISCLQNLDLLNDLQMPIDGILSLLRKLCSILVMVPGNPKNGVTCILKRILSILDCQSWIKPRMRIQILCAFVSLLATSSQNKLPYDAMHDQFICNHYLFYGDPTYSQELKSLSHEIVQNLVNIVAQESSQAARGNMALEACNCITSSFEMSKEMLAICFKLLDTAKSCLGVNDKYLLSTINFVHKSTPLSLQAGHK